MIDFVTQSVLLLQVSMGTCRYEDLVDDGVITWSPGVAQSLSRLHDECHLILRVFYVVSTGQMSLGRFSSKLKALGGGGTRRDTLEEIPGISCVAFYAAGDGPDRDISNVMRGSLASGGVTEQARAGIVTSLDADGSAIVQLEGGPVRTHLTSLRLLGVPEGQPHISMGSAVLITQAAPTSNEVGSSFPVSCSAPKGRESIDTSGHEMLCISVNTPGGALLVGWAVGRISIMQSVGQFDIPVSTHEAREARSCFLRSWSLRCQAFRGFRHGIKQGERFRARSEARMVESVASGLRLAALEVQAHDDSTNVGPNQVQEAVANHAFDVALELSSRSAIAKKGPVYYSHCAFTRSLWGLTGGGAEGGVVQVLRTWSASLAIQPCAALFSAQIVASLEQGAVVNIPGNSLESMVLESILKGGRLGIDEVCMKATRISWWKVPSTNLITSSRVISVLP
jgi:hypothetical protein